MSRRNKILGERPETVVLTCAWCGRRLRPNFKLVSETVPDENGYSTSARYAGLYGYGYGSDGLFCTLGHGYLYGKRAALERAGRRKK